MQISQSTFKYHELEGSARERARQHYIEHWIHDEWYDYIFEDAKGEAPQHGFYIEDIRFSGFWSQGDGASWTGDVRLPVFIERYVPESIGRDCWLWLMDSGWVHDRLNIYQKGNHYCHSNTMSVGNIEDYTHDLTDEVLEIDCILKGAPVGTLWHLMLADTACPIKSPDDLEELVLTVARNYADEIYSRLQGGYEHECSDDNISEHYDANEVLFNEEGEIYDEKESG